MKLKVKFDFIQNIEKQMEKASEEEIREYRENKEEFIAQGIEKLNQTLKDELNYDDYCWIENLEVEYED